MRVSVNSSNHAKCARFNRTCFFFTLIFNTPNQHDNEQTAHRHRNLSLLRSISFAALHMCLLHEMHLSTRQKKRVNSEDAHSSLGEKKAKVIRVDELVTFNAVSLHFVLNETGRQRAVRQFY